MDPREGGGVDSGAEVVGDGVFGLLYISWVIPLLPILLREQSHGVYIDLNLKEVGVFIMYA